MSWAHTLSLNPCDWIYWPRLFLCGVFQLFITEIFLHVDIFGLFVFQVVFVKKVSPFSSINTTQMQSDKKYDIYFSDGKVFSLYR